MFFAPSKQQGWPRPLPLPRTLCRGTKGEMTEEGSVDSREDEFNYSLLEESYPREDITDGFKDLDYEDLLEILAKQLEEVDGFLKNSSGEASFFASQPLPLSPSQAPSDALQEAKTQVFGDTLEQLLRTNRRYQQVLRDQLVLLEESQRKTRELQRWLKVLLIQIRRRRKVEACETPAPFVDATGRQPPETEDTKRYKGILSEYHRVLRHTPKWTDKEKSQLAKGVRQLNQAILVDRILAGKPVETPSLPFPLAPRDPNPARMPSSPSGLGDFFGEVDGLLTISRPTPAPSNAAAEDPPSSSPALRYQQVVTAVQKLPHKELEMNVQGVDWNKIAALFVTSRSADECKTQWVCNQHPLINLAPFSDSEKRRLLALVKKHGEDGDWVSIAEELSPDRTAWQCLMQYRQSLAGRSYTSGKWTAEEDRLLLEGVALYGDKDAWADISELLDGRTAPQCIHRWFKTLNPDKKTGRWTPYEDAWLLAAVRRQQRADLDEPINWAIVQSFVPHRTDVQCRERYMNVLNPRLLHGEFTPEEDQLLRAAVGEHGEGKWALVASLVPNRTDNQCRRRWLFLKSINTKHMRATRRGKRAVRGRGRPKRKP